MADIADTHVPYPGCYCADCVEGSPVAQTEADTVAKVAQFLRDQDGFGEWQDAANAVEREFGTPSARITGDKDRENPVEGAPLAKEAADRLRLWFFRECNSGTRRQLFSIFGLPLDEIRNQGAERLYFNHILAALGPRP